MWDLLLKNGTCILPKSENPEELKAEKADLGISKGLIADIGLNLPAKKAKEIIDLEGLHLLPGLIDSQVHFREPGGEAKEDLFTGTKAALLGGITAVFEMPNTSPPTTNKQALQDKVQRAQKKAHCDFAFFAGASGENAEILTQLEKEEACCGVKMFMGSSTGDLLVAQEHLQEKVFQNGRRRMALHCEDEKRLLERKKLLGPHPHVKLHPLIRDEACALIATQKAVKLAHKFQRPIHVLHVTTAEEMAFLKAHKDIASVECTPQHLTLWSPDCYDRLGTFAQMNPPLREKKHLQALWKAVDENIVDIIGSDHAPHTLEEKSKPYPQSPSGMPGVQTTLPLMLHHRAQGKISLEKLVKLMCVNPCRLYKVQNRGALQKGLEAHITVVDLKAQKTIEKSWLQSRCGWSPFEGMKVTGWPFMTLLRGKVVMREDEVIGEAQGEALKFSKLNTV